MSVSYRAIGWNRQKRIYDGVLALGIALFLSIFLAASAAVFPDATIETLLIRAFGTGAFLLLNVILAIGPLTRLDARFLPLLYNRRHLGVSMFLLAAFHGIFSIVQFHSLGDMNPLVSVLVSSATGSPSNWLSLARFPFQPLGLAALVILLFMAATSHDFWLKNLTPPLWKRLHMLVYVAYGLLAGHVSLGALQSETSPVIVGAFACGLATVIALHLAAARLEARTDQPLRTETDGWIDAGAVDAIPENAAIVLTVPGIGVGSAPGRRERTGDEATGPERVAVFRFDGKICAVSNVCQHQNGPLGEGRIVDGCITCPWHGYQYLPESGQSPPPFEEKIATYRTKVIDGRVRIDPSPLAPGTFVAPSRDEIAIDARRRRA